MELATTYAIFLGALIGLALLHQTSLAAGQLVWKMYARLIQKRLEYPLIATRPQGSTNVSRLDCVFITSFVAANAACLALKITNQAQIATRSGQLFSINVILLYLGGHTSIYADKIFRVPVEKYSLMHRWAGRVCVGEAILHAVTAGIAQPGSFKRLNISVSQHAKTAESICSLNSTLIATDCDDDPGYYIRRFSPQMALRILRQATSCTIDGDLGTPMATRDYKEILGSNLPCCCNDPLDCAQSSTHCTHRTPKLEPRRSW